MTSLDNDLERELEKMGEAEVRSRLARGDFGMVGSSKSTAVKAWLDSKESERRSARENKALSNSEEAYSMACSAAAAAAEALSKSREVMTHSQLAAANSRRAIVIAIVAMACSIVAVFTAVMTVLFN